jgi:hypothetical protein
MSALFSPFGNSQVVDTNGDPAMGYTVTTYAAGSSALLASYTDAGGLSANANPVTLDSAGRNPNGQFWLTAGLSYKFVLKDADGVVVRTVDGITGTNDPAMIGSIDQWVAYAGAPTYISATSFSVAGDQTSSLHAGRRVKTANTAGTRYSTITGSSFGAGLTTVTVANDSGTLDSGLSAVSYGVLSYTDPSMPGLQASKTSDGYQKLPSGLILQWGSASTNGSGVATFTFPVAFPTACLNTQVSTFGAGSFTAAVTSQTSAAVQGTMYSSVTGAAQAGGTLRFFSVGY